MKHLVRETHDVTCQPTSVWCEPRDGWRNMATHYVEDATCPACLMAAIDYGDECRARLLSLQVEALGDRK